MLGPGARWAVLRAGGEGVLVALTSLDIVMKAVWMVDRCMVFGLVD